MDLIDSLIARLGLCPHKRYGHNHGAPLGTWILFGGGVALAALGMGCAAYAG
jgi:hypothetical protein